MSKYIIKVELSCNGFIDSKYDQLLKEKKFKVLKEFSKKTDNKLLERITLLVQWANSCNGKILKKKRNFLSYKTSYIFEFNDSFDFYIFKGELYSNNSKFKVLKSKE